jgi:hypothetical protein
MGFPGVLEARERNGGSSIEQIVIQRKQTGQFDKAMNNKSTEFWKTEKEMEDPLLNQMLYKTY